MGQSGSGKTTLLNLIGGLDMPEQGEILVDKLVLGRDISLEKYRQNYVAICFPGIQFVGKFIIFRTERQRLKDFLWR